MIYYSTRIGEIPTIAQIGGKGHSLAQMFDKNSAVPLFLILKTDFFETWIEALKCSGEWNEFTQLKDSDLNNPTLAVKRLCKTLEYSESQQKILEDVIKFFKKDGISMFAVRSSSPEEDLEGASFAGLYETKLGVVEETLKDAIKICFVSIFDERVVSYKIINGFDPTQPKIAVIIQKQIISEISGVAFSLNPITNDYDEVVIDANFGLGETVVDGTITPDHFVVNKVDNTIIEKQKGNKNSAVWIQPEGGTISKAPSNQEEFCLNDKQVIEISTLTSLVEKEYKKPMDIEWAYENGVLYLLQARPITSYIKLPPIMITKPGEQKKLYIDGLLTEQGLVESLSPLGTPLFGLMAGYEALKLASDYQDAVAVVAAGRIYSNVGNFAKIMGKKMVLKTFILVDSLGVQILEKMDLKRYIPRKRQKGLIKSVIKMVMSQTGIKALIRVNKASNNPEKYLKFFLDENIKLQNNLKKIYENYSIEDDFIDFINNIFPNLINKWMKNVSLPPLIARMLASSKIKKIFKSESESIQDQLIYLEQAFSDNVTIEMGMLLFELSQFSEIQDINSEEKFIKMLNEEQFSPKFMEKWNLFIDKYGFRGPGELDIAKKRYYENPQEIFGLFKNMRTYDDPLLTPQGVFDEGVKRREETAQKLIAFLENKSKSKVKSFKKRYKVVETFAAYRETPKYYIILGINYIRQAILKVANKWVEINRLDAVDQAFYLNLNEYVQAIKDESLDLRSLVSANITYRNQFRNNVNIPTLIDSRGRIPRLKREQLKDNEFMGTPISPGTVKGPVKILKRPDEKPIHPGDILVTRATDPGWTMLFLNAAGILIETGGMLQHGASVARELCKPCIVGLDDIASILKDGQIVELDGSTGLVKIIE
ncbi:MAG: PEP/pyruvate-binding domain-containing protein [Promethearchaeota archaeon]